MRLNKHTIKAEKQEKVGVAVYDPKTDQYNIIEVGPGISQNMIDEVVQVIEAQTHKVSMAVEDIVTKVKPKDKKVKVEVKQEEEAVAVPEPEVVEEKKDVVVEEKVEGDSDATEST